MSTKEIVLIVLPILVIANFYALKYLLLRALQPIIDKLTQIETESQLVTFLINEKTEAAKKQI